MWPRPARPEPTRRRGMPLPWPRGRPPWPVRPGPPAVGGQTHDGHAAHGVTGQHGVVHVAGLEHRGQVVGQCLHAQRCRPPAAGPVAALVVEHDPVAGLDQTAGHRHPYGVAATPAVGEHDAGPFAVIPDGEAGAVGGGDGQRGRFVQAAPTQGGQLRRRVERRRPRPRCGLRSILGPAIGRGTGRHRSQPAEHEHPAPPSAAGAGVGGRRAGGRWGGAHGNEPFQSGGGHVGGQRPR
jgi:hypothetical protein